MEGGQGAPSLLEQTYIAGKVAAKIGPDRVRGMSQAQISRWARDHGLVRSKEDEARLDTLKKASSLWMAALVEDLTNKVRREVALAESKYTAEVITRDSDGSLRKSLWDTLKAGFVSNLIDNVTKVMSTFENWVDRFVQTELAKFFQEGQISSIRQDEEVYKIPRTSACPECLRLHVDTDGHPYIYKLSAVMGNSNIGAKPFQWRFTIGPVHPHCYCVLYRVEVDPPSPILALALAKKESRETSLKRRKEVLEQAKLKYQQALQGVDPSSV